MIIPYQEIEKETLHSLISEFVSRDGTDNGFDQSLDSKIQQVIKQLESGEVVITFDFETESTNIVPKAEAIEDQF